MLQKCVFLDRDGVLNEERGDWTFRIEDFRILPGVGDAIDRLKSEGFLTIIITNQSGISKGLYSVQDMQDCHEYLQKELGQTFDDIYFSPYHPTVTESLGRKPGTLLFERAIALHSVDVTQSWMIGDKERDLIPAKKLGIRCILVDPQIEFEQADFVCESLQMAVEHILG